MSATIIRIFLGLVETNRAMSTNSLFLPHKVMCSNIAVAFSYTLSEACSGVNWADLMAAQGAFGTDFYDRSTRTIVGSRHDAFDGV